MPNVELLGRSRLSAFRKIALGTWQTTYDPSIYGTMRVRADKLQEYIARFRAKYGKKLTVTHVVAKVMALALKGCPEANSILRFKTVYQRKNIDIAILVLMEHEGKKDLSAAKLLSVDSTSLVDMVSTLEERAQTIRARKDKELEKTRQTMRLVPAFLMHKLLNFLGFLLYTLNLDLRWIGLPKDPFGSAVVTSIGSLGLQTGYVPLVPYSRVPIFIAPGELVREPVVEGERIVPATILDLNVTFDHRIIDGGHAADLAKTVRTVLENPFEHLDPV